MPWCTTPLWWENKTLSLHYPVSCCTSLCPFTLLLSSPFTVSKPLDTDDFPHAFAFPLPFTWNAHPTLQVYPKLPLRGIEKCFLFSFLRCPSAQLEWFHLYSFWVFVAKLLLHLNLFCIIVTRFHFYQEARSWLSHLSSSKTLDKHLSKSSFLCKRNENNNISLQANISFLFF